jgi:hypothetical protein
VQSNPTSLCYILQNKFVGLVLTSRQTCRLAHEDFCLKNWAIEHVQMFQTNKKMKGNHINEME